MASKRGADAKRSIRAQSAMEYLLTYGWAILLIGIALAVIYSLGIFSPGPGTGRCLPTPQFSCVQGSLSTTGTLSFTFEYLGTGELNVTAVGCSNSTSAPNATWSSSAIALSPLEEGQSESLVAACVLAGNGQIGVPFSGTLWVQYNNGQGIEEEEIGSVYYGASYVKQTPQLSQTENLPISGSGFKGMENGGFYNPSNGYIYLLGGYGSTGVFSGNQLVASLSDPSPANIPNEDGDVYTWATLYDPINGYIYVSADQALLYSMPSISLIFIYSGITPVANFSIGTGLPSYMSYDPASGDIYITDQASGTLTILSGTNVIGTVTGLGDVDQSAYNPENGHMYVADGGNDDVLVFSGNYLVQTIPVQSNPRGLAYDPSTGDIYVTNIDSDTVSVISNYTVVATIPVQNMPIGVAYDPSNGYMYVANQGSGSVSVISGTTVITTITGLTQPYYLIYDPINGLMYVASTNGYYDTISITS